MKMSSVVVCTIKLVGAIFVVLQFDLLFSNYSGVVAVAAKHVACIEKERHAFLELKASLVLDDSNLLPSWDSKSDGCCAWEGIGCSNQTGHVEMLDLNGDQVIPFRGKINRSVIDSHLQYLDLSWNGLKGTIPHQLGNLSHLHYLDLSSNFLVGTIPHQLGSLSNLQELHLEYNEGLNLPIRLNERCQVILDSNQFEGSIPPFFRRAEFPQMSKNKFSETHLLLCSNSTIDKLRILDLSMNQLSRKLHDCWSHLKALEFLDLSDNTVW